MAESTDSDIIFRKRPKVGRNAGISDESSTSEIFDSSDAAVGDFEPLFFEIFGEGNEYDYIYKKKTAEPEKQPTRTESVLAPSECYTQVKCFTRGFNQLFKDLDSEIVKNLMSGYSPEYLALHRGKMTVRELYFIKDVIEELESSSGQDTQRAECKLVTPGLLLLSEFITNLETLESVYTPVGSIDLPFALTAQRTKSEWDYDEIQGLEPEAPVATVEENDRIRICEHFKKTIAQIASNPVFAKRVFYSTVVSILEPASCESSVHSLRYLQKLYCKGSGDINDQIRSLIIQKAFEAVAVNRTVVEKRLIQQGIHPAPGGLQELVDLIFSLRSCDGPCAGVYLDKSLFSVVKIDQDGNFTESAVFKEHEMPALQTFLDGVTNVCLTSTSPAVRFALQNAGVNFLYVPRRLSFFEDYKELSIPYNIALAVQNPILYFTRLWYNISNRYPVLNYRSSDTWMLERAIHIACATCRLDWINTITHRFGFMLLKMLNLDVSDPYFNLEKLDTLESLKEIFDDATYCNICTFFNLLSSKNPLDRLLIHPTNYSMAVVLFKSAYHSLKNTGESAIINQSDFDLEKNKDEIVQLFVSNPALLSEYSPGYVDDDMKMLFNIRLTILQAGAARFSGASDDQIFCDVVPQLDREKTYAGTIVKVGVDFYLCQAANVTVFIKKAEELVLNQIVKVNIIEESPATLSYVGKIVNDVSAYADKFRSHALFRDMPYDMLEAHMKQTNSSIAVRPSSTPGHCCVVCKVENDIFLTFKLSENIDLANGHAISYVFKDNSYTRIDTFINDYVKRVYKLIQSVVSFKYYFQSAEQAKKYLSEPGEYVKYAIVLSREAPGYVEFLLEGKRVFVKIEGGRLALRDRSFENIDEFIRFVKTHIKSL